MKKVFTLSMVLLLLTISIAGCTFTMSTPTTTSSLQSSAAVSGLPDGMGKLTFLVMDPPPPDMEHIWVDVKNLEIHKAGEGWTTIAVDMEPFDLKGIVDIPSFLADEIVEAGIYTQIRLEVESVVIEVGEEEPYESHTARVPSGTIKLVGCFEVVEGQETEITIDFNGEKSVNVTGKGEYIFKPVIKLLIPESAKPCDDQDGDVETLAAVLTQSESGAVAELSTDPDDAEVKVIHLQTTGEAGSGNEAGIVIELPAGTTLGDIESVSWWVWAEAGYPPHLDIVMDHNGNGIVDEEDMLTAEMAYNNFAGSELDSTPPLSPTLGQWLQTFELNSGDGYGDINNDTMLWVTRMGSGNDDAPWGTFSQWKSGGSGVTNPPGNADVLGGNITHNAEVLRLEIEIDNWVLQSDVFVKGIEIILDGTLYIVEF